MSGLVTGTPIWVWPLLVVLLVVGLRARHEREVPALLVYLLPLLGLSALRSVAGLGPVLAVWGIFALAYGAGVMGGYRMQGRFVLARAGRRVRLAGETVTLALMMLIFAANFSAGFMKAVAPAVYGNSLFHAGFAVVVALASGSFAGRAIRVWGAKNTGSAAA